MTHFYKLRSTRSPLYLYNLIPPERDLNYNLRIPYDYDQHIERTTRFSHTYFQNCVSEWNRLDVSMRSSQTISELERKFLKLIRPPKRSIFNIYDLEGIKLLTQLRVEFSDLRYHRYRHNFHCTSPTCLCQLKITSIFSCTARGSLCNADLSYSWSPIRLMLIWCAYRLMNWLMFYLMVTLSLLSNE